MNINKVSIILISFLIGLNVFGFTPPDSTTRLIDKASAVIIVEEGKKAFYQGQTKLALTKFRQAFVKDQYNAKAAFWVAQCHYKLNNYGYALQYAKKVELLDNKVDQDLFYLIAESYHRQTILDSALLYYALTKQEMSKHRYKELRVSDKVRECEMADSLIKLKHAFVRELVNSEVNSGYDDYGPILNADGKTLYFVSRRNDTQGGGINPDDQTFYEDTYKAVWNEEEQKWDSITNQLGKLNSDGFDAINHISSDGLTAYITLNTTSLDIKKTTRSSDICMLGMANNGNWNTPKPIKNKTINTSFFDGAATLTADGNTLYFVSDRNGERHKTDIYVSHREGKKWGDAKPLPDNINTKDFETTPYISSDGRYLYFSSNGLNGMGGYDIYMSENKGNNTWSDPINLGGGINSVNDDTHFRYYPMLEKAYLASFRLQNRKSSIDIYEVDFEGFELLKSLFFE